MYAIPMNIDTYHPALPRPLGVTWHSTAGVAAARSHVARYSCCVGLYESTTHQWLRSIELDTTMLFLVKRFRGFAGRDVILDPSHDYKTSIGNAFPLSAPALLPCC